VIEIAGNHHKKTAAAQEVGRAAAASEVDMLVAVVVVDMWGVSAGSLVLEIGNKRPVVDSRIVAEDCYMVVVEEYSLSEESSGVEFCGCPESSKGKPELVVPVLFCQ
jgi:hypothetical protein